MDGHKCSHTGKPAQDEGGGGGVAGSGRSYKTVPVGRSKQTDMAGRSTLIGVHVPQ